MIRLLFNDVQILKDGRHPQAEEMYRRWVWRVLHSSELLTLLQNSSEYKKSSSKKYYVSYLHRIYRLHERLVNLRTDYNLRLKSSGTTIKFSQTQVSQQSTMKGRPEKDDVTLRYVKDLLGWVEENQLRIDGAEWGSDLPSVESQLGSHRGLHQTVEDFRSKIERARADEVAALSEPLDWTTYCPKLCSWF